jgi:hypothetical protein
MRSIAGTAPADVSSSQHANCARPFGPWAGGNVRTSVDEIAPAAFSRLQPALTQVCQKCHLTPAYILPMKGRVGEWGRPASDMGIPVVPVGVGAASTAEFRGGASMLEHAGNTPVVICPACRKPMTPSEPIPITNRMSEIVYRCDACDATTLRSVKVLAGESGNRRGIGER